MELATNHHHDNWSWSWWWLWCMQPNGWHNPMAPPPYPKKNLHHRMHMMMMMLCWVVAFLLIHLIISFWHHIIFYIMGVCVKLGKWVSFIWDAGSSISLLLPFLPFFPSFLSPYLPLTQPQILAMDLLVICSLTKYLVPTLAAALTLIRSIICTKCWNLPKKKKTKKNSSFPRTNIFVEGKLQNLLWNSDKSYFFPALLSPPFISFSITITIIISSSSSSFLPSFLPSLLSGFLSLTLTLTLSVYRQGFQY